MDYNESTEEALRREIKEEMDLEVGTLKYFGSASNKYLYKNVQYFTCDVFYTVIIESVSSFTASDEVSELVLVHPSELDLSKIAFASVRKMLGQYCNNFKK